MNQIATTQNAVVAEALGTARTATIPALVGLIGATVSLPMGVLGLPLFFLAASLPMSALGLALGVNQHNHAAMLFGAAGVALATAGLAWASLALG